MIYSQLRFTHPDDLLFSIQSEGREIKCRVAEEWMYQEYGFRAGADMMLSQDDEMKNFFVEYWPNIQKHLAERIEKKQFERDGTICLRGR